MRCLLFFLIIRHAARLDGFENIVTLIGRIRPPEATKVFIGLAMVGVGGVVEVTIAIGMPDFQHGIGYRIAFTIQDLPSDKNTLAFRLVIHKDIFITIAEQAIVEEGANGLARRLNLLHSRASFVSNGVMRLPL